MSHRVVEVSNHDYPTMEAAEEALNQRAITLVGNGCSVLLWGRRHCRLYCPDGPHFNVDLSIASDPTTPEA